MELVSEEGEGLVNKHALEVWGEREEEFEIRVRQGEDSEWRRCIIGDRAASSTPIDEHPTRSTTEASAGATGLRIRAARAEGERGGSEGWGGVGTCAELGRRADTEERRGGWLAEIGCSATPIPGHAATAAAAAAAGPSEAARDGRGKGGDGGLWGDGAVECRGRGGWAAAGHGAFE